MRSDNSNGSRGARARGFVALFAIMLAMGLGALASPAAAAPFAYVGVPAPFSSVVSVIDTATNPPSVVATVPMAGFPVVVAVTPDGKHVYVGADCGCIIMPDSVLVIDTAMNMVVATIPVVHGAIGGLAITPDGKHAYVTTGGGGVSVIDTASNTVVGTFAVAGVLERSPSRRTGHTSMSPVVLFR